MDQLGQPKNVDLRTLYERSSPEFSSLLGMTSFTFYVAAFAACLLNFAQEFVTPHAVLHFSGMVLSVIVLLAICLYLDKWKKDTAWREEQGFFKMCGATCLLAISFGFAAGLWWGLGVCGIFLALWFAIIFKVW